MNKSSPPSIRPALKSSQGAVFGGIGTPTSPTPKAVSFTNRSPGRGTKMRVDTQTFRSGISSVEERKLEGELIREAVDDLNKVLNNNSIGGVNTKSLDSLYEIFTQIIQSPYIDEHRLIDLAQYRSKFARFPEAIKLLNDIGFKQGSTSQHLIFPYDQTFPKMIIAKELLLGKVAKKREEFSYSNFEAKLSFPTFQKLSQVLGAHLLPKTAKQQRSVLKLSLEEVQYLYDGTGAQTLEQYVIIQGQGTGDFATLANKFLQPPSKSQEFVENLRELWLECNVLRRAGIYVRQTFADIVSKADLCDNFSDQSRIARNLLMIDCVQAKGLRKHTNGRLITIEEAVFMFIEREAFRQQGLIQDVEALDNKICSGLLQKDKVPKFWGAVSDVILERMARRLLKHRPTISDEEAASYAAMKEPEIDIHHLNEETRMRIGNLDELIELKQRMQVDRLRAADLQAEYKQKVHRSIYDARTWLYQKQLIDDFVLFTMINNLCIDNKVETAFNLRRTFKRFVNEQSRPGMAVIAQQEEDKEGGKNTQIDQPNTIEKQVELLKVMRQQNERLKGDKAFSKEWVLYNNSAPIIIQACIINNHFEKLIELVERGASLNVQDYQGWTPLHVACFIGHSEVIKVLLRNGALVDVRDNEGRLPLDVAIVHSHVEGEESSAALLLKNGSPLTEELWHKLLIFSLDKDLVIYVRLAHERGIYLHNVDDETKFSFHNAVCCGAKKIIAFLGETFGIQTMRRIGMTPDGRAMTAVDYANISEDKELQELVSRVIGDKLLQVKPKSLIEVEEKLEASQMNESMGRLTQSGGFSPTSKMSITNVNPPALKEHELAIFNREYHTQQQQHTIQNSKPTIPSNFIEEQRSLKAQRELEAQKKFLQQELDITKKQTKAQNDDFERNIEQFKNEMQYKHREELDRAQRRILEKDSEVDSLKKLIAIQQNSMEQLMRQFEDLKVIKQKEEQLEKKQKEIEQYIQEREVADLTQEQIDRINAEKDPFFNRSQARSPKKQAPPAIPSVGQSNENKKENAEQLEVAIKENIDNIEAKMRETQNKMKMLERERALMHKQHTKACFIF